MAHFSGRPLLRAIMVLGTILTLVGGTGIFAVFSDRATTGVNDVSSGQLTPAADIQLAGASIDTQLTCGQFAENLVTGFFTIADLQPTLGESHRQYFCLRNVGSSALTLTASAIDIVDTDVACTGDEDAFGDATCGSDQAGELSSVVRAVAVNVDCSTAAFLGQTDSVDLSAFSAAPLPIDGIASAGSTLAPGATACYWIEIRYPDSQAEADIQIAQSDRVQWRFAFDGSVPSA